MVPPKATRRRGPARQRFVLRAGAVAAVGALSSGARMVFDPKGGWAMDAEALRPATLQTLVCAARDLHSDSSRLDADYARAVKQLDTAATDDGMLRMLIEEGVAQLDRLARQRFGKAYIGVAGESARLAILRAMGATPFLHRLKHEVSQALAKLGTPTPLVAANTAWPSPDRWPSGVPEPGRAIAPSQETRAGA